jgi:spermidine synthase
MGEHETNPPSEAAARPLLPWLLLLFVGSGCSALVYEIVWFQLLELVIGSSAVSLGVLLGTFMGGMCLGSLALPRLISARRHPLRVYALLELGVGAIGLLVLFGMPLVDRLYVAHAGHGLAGLLARGAVGAACLLPPTLLMGATLPAIARWVETTPRGMSWLGFFYGGNIAGAVFGCLLAGFYLLRVHDMATATYAAAALNAAVALAAFGLSFLAPNAIPAAGPAAGPAARVPGAWAVHVAIGLSGLCALGAEVVWTRVLALMFGATVYTFSIILAVFMTGLGLGSSLGALLARATARPRLVLGACQLLLAAAVAWAAFISCRSLPYWPINPRLSTSPWYDFQLDLLRCAWAVLPATVLWGASFPLALAAVAAPGRDPGRLVGGVYAANTVGAILGALATSLVLVPGLGTPHTQRVLIGLSAAAALLMLAVLVRRPREAPSSGGSRGLARLVAGVGALAAAAGLAGWLAWGVPEVPGEVVAYGRMLPYQIGEGKVGTLVYVGEGRTSSVAVSRWSDGTRLFHVSGKVEASSELNDMRLQRMLGHIPALFHPRPRSVLVVGCGAGVTAGSFVLHPSVERIVICELEPLIPPNVAAAHFAAENYDVLKDPRVEVVYDDARHYVLTAPEKFDIITSDPIHPWVKGAATLYTREYFEMCKQHLNPGGVVTQWVPLYESDQTTVRSELATFFEAFPDGTIWGNAMDNGGYDTVVLGQAGPTRVNVDEMQQRLDRADHAAVAKSLKEVGYNGAIALLATYAGRGPDLRPWLADAEINGDRNLRLQYLAGMGSHLRLDTFIYQQILTYRKFPEDLFIDSSLRRTALKRYLESSSADDEP